MGVQEELRKSLAKEDPLKRHADASPQPVETSQQSIDALQRELQAVKTELSEMSKINEQLVLEKGNLQKELGKCSKQSQQYDDKELPAKAPKSSSAELSTKMSGQAREEVKGNVGKCKCC